MEMEGNPRFSSESYIPFASEAEQVTCFTPEATGTHVRERNDFGQQRNRNILKACCSVSNIDAPWRRTSKYSFGLIGLHEEINDFYETMLPKEKETELRLKVIEHITRIVHSLWPQAQVEIFGSFRTGLYLPSSDIDMVIFGEWKSLPLSTLSEALEKNAIFNSDINIIANATVPIIRMVHSPSGIRVDISFNMSNGVESAKLVKKMMKQHPALPRLVLILKQFLVHRGLNEVYNGGMSSYCLTLLIVSFLQGYHKPNFEPSANFGAALLEFFEHYGVNFNYDKVSIHFQSGGLYKPRKRGGNLLSVEDPLMSGHDVAKGTYLMNLLKMSFQNAFYILSKAVTESIATKRPVNSFLHLIVKVEPEVLTNREIMLNNHSKIMNRLSKLIDKLNESQSEETASTSTPRSNPKNFYKKKKIGKNIYASHISEISVTMNSDESSLSDIEGYLGSICEQNGNSDNSIINTTSSCDDCSSDEVEIVKELKVNLDKHECGLCSEGLFLVKKLLEFGGVLNDEYKHACEICNAGFKTKADVNKHKKLHEDGVLSEDLITENGTSFINSSSNSFEISSSTPSTSCKTTKGSSLVMCDICLKLLKSEKTLVTHKINMHTSKTCEICQLTFLGLNKFKKHCMSHTNSKKFLACPACKKQFLYTKSLQEHVCALKV